MMTYTAFKLNIDGSLSHKELLDDIGQVNEWMVRVYGKFASVRIIQDQTGKVREYTDNGVDWERVI